MPYNKPPQNRGLYPPAENQKHIIRGDDYLPDGLGNAAPQYLDPMEDFTAGVGDGTFVSNPYGVIEQINRSQAVGLDSAAGVPGESINMSDAGDNSDPEKGGIGYGTRNTGR